MHRNKNTGLGMLTCKEIAFILASKEEISLLKKTELRMHLLMCKHCSNYNKQLNFLEKGVKKLFKVKTDVDTSKLENLKKEIIAKIPKTKNDK